MSRAARVAPYALGQICAAVAVAVAVAVTVTVTVTVVAAAEPYGPETPERIWQRAIAENRVATIKKMLDRIHPVDRPAANGKTALMAAARRGDAALCERLLRAGADVNARNHNGGTPLMFATAAGEPRLVSLLLERGADVAARASNGWSALTMAAVKRSTAVTQRLLDAGAPVNDQDVYGWTPLMRALFEGRDAQARLLLARAEIDLEKINDQGQTALHVAVIQRRAELIELLLDRGAVQRADFAGYTPEKIAAELDRGDLLALLSRYR